jgi:tocopherol O-methyltransferase
MTAAHWSGRHNLVGAIRDHYDRLAIFYRTLWGVHIHHGYWEAEESAAQAQVNLTTHLARRSQMVPGSHVLDVGCGFGGSALWLARHLACTVTGITISPVQAAMASWQARRERLAAQTQFRLMDANRLALPAASFDAVWVIECSEHLVDKAQFFKACAHVLRPHGRLALCAWLSAAEPGNRRQEKLVAEVCHGMLLPSLATNADYVRWMEGAGLIRIEAEDATLRVARTWERCIAAASRPWARALLRFMDEDTRAFVASFPTMAAAFTEGAMIYGIFTARKP